MPITVTAKSTLTTGGNADDPRFPASYVGVLIRPSAQAFRGIYSELKRQYYTRGEHDHSDVVAIFGLAPARGAAERRDCRSEPTAIPSVMTSALHYVRVNCRIGESDSVLEQPCVDLHASAGNLSRAAAVSARRHHRGMSRELPTSLHTTNRSGQPSGSPTLVGTV